MLIHILWPFFLDFVFNATTNKGPQTTIARTSNTLWELVYAQKCAQVQIHTVAVTHGGMGGGGLMGT